MIRHKHKLAICYHGRPRSLRQVYKNHIEGVINPLGEAGSEYEIFVHTWEIEGPQFIWSNPRANLVWNEKCLELGFSFFNY